jgi:hypothetical protein
LRLKLVNVGRVVVDATVLVQVGISADLAPVREWLCEPDSDACVPHLPVPSLLAIATLHPSGLHTTAVILAWCASGGVTAVLTAFHTRAVLSAFVVATHLRLGLHATTGVTLGSVKNNVFLLSCASGGVTACPCPPTHPHRAAPAARYLNRAHLFHLSARGRATKRTG